MQFSARQLREIRKHEPKIIVVVDTPEFKASLLPPITESEYQGSAGASYRKRDDRAAARLAGHRASKPARVYRHYRA